MQTVLPDLSAYSIKGPVYRTAHNPRILYTAGIKHLTETLDADWLIAAIVNSQFGINGGLDELPLQFWTLTVAAGQAILTCEDNLELEIYRQEIPQTDFPEPGISILVRHRLIMLYQESV